MEDIAGFLEARYAEEEAAARRDLDSTSPMRYVDCDEDSADLIDLLSADRVLRQVAAGRARLDGHAPTDLEAEFGADTVAAFSRAHGEPASRCQTCRVPYPCRTLRIDAAVYAGHPDFKETWKP